MLTKKYKGLTLIEALVLGICVLILVAVFLPHSCGNRERSKRISCTNNVRQIITALHMYADDPVNGFLPKAGTGTESMWMIYPKYINEYKVFSCPSNPTLSQMLLPDGRGVNKNSKMGYWMDNRHKQDQGEAGIVGDVFDKTKLSSSHGSGSEFAMILGLVEGSAHVIKSLNRKVGKDKDDDISNDDSKNIGLEYDTWLKD